MTTRKVLVEVSGLTREIADADSAGVGAGLVFTNTAAHIDAAGGTISFTDTNGTKNLSAMPVMGTIILDFGAFPGSSNASVAVADAGIKAGSVTTAQIEPIATADHSADEHIADPPAVYADSVVAGVGFTVRGSYTQQDGARTYGKWTVAWSRT
jgi:hypothetical protein